jgi:serine/threonine-protein kinase
MQQLPGTKYQIVRQLGAGGMGVVYQVVKPPNIQGVLKLMSSELTQHDDLRVRFFDEVRILAQLEHPNIVRVFDYDKLPDGAPFYVMELLNGRTVRDVLMTVGRVPPRVAYEITRQLLEALQCAHTHDIPVIHRDIKPENIFLHQPRHGDPVVKLIDFGVSSVADRKHDESFVGTWSYAAPEQIRGHRPTPQTDLYAVGLVLYEMLAGRGPFDHHPDWKMLSIAQLEEIPAPVSQFAPWVPPSIVELIASVLSKDPRARPRDAHAFAAKLYELEWAKAPATETVSNAAPLSAMLGQIGGETPVIIPQVVARPDTFASAHTDASPAQRSRTGYFALAALIVLGGFAIALLIIVKGAAAPPPPPAPSVVAVTPPPPAPEPAPVVVAAPPSASSSAAPPPPAPRPAPKAQPATPAPKSTGREDFLHEL